MGNNLEMDLIQKRLEVSYRIAELELLEQDITFIGLAAYYSSAGVEAGQNETALKQNALYNIAKKHFATSEQEELNKAMFLCEQMRNVLIKIIMEEKADETH